VLLFIFGPHINIQNTKKKLKKWKKNIHQWEEHEKYLENCHRLVGGIKIFKVKKLTVQFWIMKAILTRKVQSEKKNSKLDV
jgi:hypothetical protein